MSRSSRSRTWVFTLNNYTDEEKAAVETLVDPPGFARYVCYGLERGEGGTPHLQGYIELESKRVLGSLKRLPGLSRAHFEPRRGTQEQAIDYCRKDGEFYEFGERLRPGRRTDLDAIRDRLDNGESMAEIAATNFSVFLQYRKGLQAYRELRISPRCWVPTVTVLCGRTGVGKTRRVFDLCGTGGVYIYAGSNRDNPWFDGYCGDINVLFDDFRGDSTIRLEFLLRLLDRYPMRVPVKGSFVEWSPRSIYITSNDPLERWYPGVDISPLRRRITHYEYIDDNLYEDIESDGS